jgi:hypothetical protein
MVQLNPIRDRLGASAMVVRVSTSTASLAGSRCCDDCDPEVGGGDAQEQRQLAGQRMRAEPYEDDTFTLEGHELRIEALDRLAALRPKSAAAGNPGCARLAVDDRGHQALPRSRRPTAAEHENRRRTVSTK